MIKNKLYITYAAAAFLTASMSIAHASDYSVTQLPAEGNVQCNDYAANKVVLSMDTSTPQETGTVFGPDSIYDNDDIGESVNYTLSPDLTSLSFGTTVPSSVPVDYAVLKSSRTVQVFMYESGGTTMDSNMTIPGGLEISAFSLCYDLGNDPLNRAPVLAPIGDQEVTVGKELTFDVSATDDGLPSGTLTIMSSQLPGASFDDDDLDGIWTFSWTPTTLDVGSVDITFTASDGELEDSETITITVNAVVAIPTCESLGTYDNTSSSTLDDTGIVCPDNGNKALVCNIELDQPFYGLVESDSCCICNNGSIDAALEMCDPSATEDTEGYDPVTGLAPSGLPLCVDPSGTVKGTNLEVTTHIEFNNDPYYCTTIGGKRTCFRY